MNATHGNIRHSKLFKIIILLVYMYSFIQLDADESPIQIDLIKIDDPLALEQIQIQVQRPFRVLIRIFGQPQQSEPAIEEPST